MTKKSDTVGNAAKESAGLEIPAQKETRKDAEAEYTAAEFAGNAERLFGKRATADLVTAAFRVERKETATLSEAKDIVARFMDKEVK